MRLVVPLAIASGESYSTLQIIGMEILGSRGEVETKIPKM